MPPPWCSPPYFIVAVVVCLLLGAPRPCSSPVVAIFFVFLPFDPTGTRDAHVLSFLTVFQSGSCRNATDVTAPGTIKSTRFRFWGINLLRQEMHSPTGGSQLQRLPQLFYCKKPSYCLLNIPNLPSLLLLLFTPLRSAVRLPPASPALFPVGARGNILSSAEGTIFELRCS